MTFSPEDQREPLKVTITIHRGDEELDRVTCDADKPFIWQALHFYPIVDAGHVLLAYSYQPSLIVMKDAPPIVSAESS